jgi:hypothetical protein
MTAPRGECDGTMTVPHQTPSRCSIEPRRSHFIGYLLLSF